MGGMSAVVAAAETATATAQCSGSIASFRALRSRCSFGETAMAVTSDDRPAVASRAVRTGRSCTPRPLPGRRMVNVKAAVQRLPARGGSEDNLPHVE